LFGKIQGETMAKIKRVITTKNGHQDAKSIKLNFFRLVKIEAITEFLIKKTKINKD